MSENIVVELEPLRALEEWMRQTVERDRPLALYIGDLAEGLPDYPLDLRSLRALLMHPSVGYQARGAIWRRLLELTGQDGAAGEEWRTACCAMALSGLWRTSARLRRSAPELAQSEVQQIALAGCWQALADLLGKLEEITEPGRIPASLCWNADRAARRFHEIEERHRAHRASLEERPEHPAQDNVPAWLHLDVHVLLRRAVEAGVIDREQADLITLTRLGGVPIHRLAEQEGVSPEALGMRRCRAEKKIAAAYRAGLLKV